MKNCQGKVIQKTNGKQGKEHIDLILTKKVTKKNRISQSLHKTHFWKNNRRGIKSPETLTQMFTWGVCIFFQNILLQNTFGHLVSLDLAHVILSLYLISSSAKIIQKNCSENIFPKFTQRSIFLVNLQTYNFIKKIPQERYT